MILKGQQIRVKKIDYVNDFRQIKNFMLKPNVNFNLAKITDTIYAANCLVKIEASEDNDMPIRIEMLVEGIFEFVENTLEETANAYLKKSGLETVFAYTRPILANITAVAGIPPINLPIINFEEADIPSQPTSKVQ